VNTAQVAVVCVTAAVVVLIAACWSLAYFRGWRITAPATSGKSVPKDAAAGAADGPSGEGGTTAALAAVPGERKGRRSG